MNRRRFHITSLLAWGGSFAGVTGGAPSQKGADRGTFLLVHGAWHSAMHWDAVAAILAGRGRCVLAIDLPGHGLNAKFPKADLRQDLAALATEPSPLKDVILDDYVAADATAARRLAQHGPLLPMTADARGTRDRWGRVPRTFIRCTLDNAIPIALQDRMIREADAFTPENRFDVKTLEADHSPFASQPEQLAAILTGLA